MLESFDQAIHRLDLLSPIILSDLVITNQSYSEMNLSEEAKLTLNVDNAGGGSEISEALSVEYMVKFFRGSQVIPEMQVEYWIDYKMIDYIIKINQELIGVSVTRAMGFPNPESFTEFTAQKLIQKKFYGLVIARNSTVEKHSFYRAVLHIWCQTQLIADLVMAAYHQLPASDLEEVIVICSVCNIPEIYLNRREVLTLTD